ncbi:MAG: exodeoxyribonuclease V subunit gamma [Mariprofundaceae bacterium]
MTFHLVSSNKVELLTEQLGAVLSHKALSSPFIAELIIVPSMPMQRWLGLQLAHLNGINCHNEYPLPATWFWQLVSSSLGASAKYDPLNKQHAAWKIFNLLPKLLEKSQFEPLKQYLVHDHQGIKRWQLSERIADVFDRYQYYRPDTIRSWSAGGGLGWQAILWRALVQQVGRSNHRVAMIDIFMQQLEQGKLKEPLPERISMFAVSSLPPLLLQVMQAVAQHTDVYLFYLIPTQGYWADLQSDKAMAKQRLQNPNEAIYLETGHSLLASWGRQGQVFQDLLLADAGLQSQEHECYSQHWPDTVLGRLQRDMFDIQMPKYSDISADDSLQVHSCHSALRECQVLHDALLKRLDDDPALKPEDILVMIPEISRYAPYIEAVFTKDEARPFIPWNLSDISVADEHPVIGSMLQLLQLPSSRFSISEVMGLLDVPEINERFDIDANQRVQITMILEQLNVCWGIDSEHKKELNLPGNIENSWQQAELRLMAGYAMGEASLWEGIAPVAIEDGAAAMMADFWQLFETLKHWRKVLAKPITRDVKAWQKLILEMMESLFREGDQTAGRLQVIRDALADLLESAGQSVLSLDLLIHYLTQALSERDMPGRYFSGGVSFCGMRPMRSLPFKVIALLGMQDTAFPSRHRKLEFDEMLKQWSPGDPCSGEMDRYLMLETLLCANHVLYISYTGRSLKDNSECQPSVLLQELLDQLKQQYGQAGIDALTYIHPMQAFSPENYQQHGYDAYWCKLANTMAHTQADLSLSAWPEYELDDIQSETDEIELSRLIRFSCNPIKYFVNNTLNIYINAKDEACDDEPFALDGLESWQLRKRMLDDFMQHGSYDVDRIKAESLLPHGGFAEHTLLPHKHEVDVMQLKLEPYQNSNPAAQAIEILIQIDDQKTCRITAQIQNYYDHQGIMHVTPSRAASKNIMPLWLEHLSLCAANKMAAGDVSVLICRDQVVRLAVIDSESAAEILKSYVLAYIQGSQSPLPIFSKISWLHATGSNEAKLKAAWQGNSFQNIEGEQDDPYVRLVMRGMHQDPIDQSCFSEWAKRFYEPLIACMEAS